MSRSGRRPYTTGTRRQVTAEWIERVKAALEAQQRGPRWLEQEAGLAKGAATKILDGSQQTSNHVDAINQALSLAPADLTVDSTEERELLAEFRAMSPAAKGHLLGLMAELRKSQS